MDISQSKVNISKNEMECVLLNSPFPQRDIKVANSIQILWWHDNWNVIKIHIRSIHVWDKSFFCSLNHPRNGGYISIILLIVSIKERYTHLTTCSGWKWFVSFSSARKPRMKIIVVVLSMKEVSEWLYFVPVVEWVVVGC